CRAVRAAHARAGSPQARADPAHDVLGKRVPRGLLPGSSASPLVCVQQPVRSTTPEALLQQLIDRADGIVAGSIDPMLTPGWPMSIKESIANCLRGLFKAPDGWVFVSADLGQIESRVLCWISGQDDKVQAYRDGRDVYTIEANALGSNSRDLGKLF